MDIEKITEPVEADDDLMTLEDFRKDCDGGMLIDYDGHGVLATATRKSSIVILPSFAFDPLPEGPWTHVVWFNR